MPQSWTAPITWSDKFDAAMLNQQLRDNLLFLRYGVEQTVGHWTRRASDDINIPLADFWNAVSVNGMEPVAVGSVATGDIVQVSCAARATGAATFVIGAQLFENGTLVATYVGPEIANGKSGSLSFSHSAAVTYTNLTVQLAIKPVGAAASLVDQSADADLEWYTWLDVSHLVPPTA